MEYEFLQREKEEKKEGEGAQCCWRKFLLVSEKIMKEPQS